MYGREEEDGAAKAKPPPRADIDGRVCAGMSVICVASVQFLSWIIAALLAPRPTAATRETDK